MTSAIGQVRSKRPSTWIAAGLAVAISPTGVAGYFGWDAWQHRCEAAVPVPDPGVEAPVIAPAELAERWPAEWSTYATDAMAPFGFSGLRLLELADGSSRTVVDSRLSLPAVADQSTVGITLGSADAVLVLYDLR